LRDHHDNIQLALKRLNRDLKGIYVKFFKEKYMVKVNRQHNIGDLRKTMGCWLDSNASSINFKFEETLFRDEENLFDLINSGIK
jgi:hypothetical protein